MTTRLVMWLGGAAGSPVAASWSFRRLFWLATVAKVLLLGIILGLHPGPNPAAFSDYVPHWPERGGPLWLSRLSCLDVGQYLWLAGHGYEPGSASNAFYPLWPAILKWTGVGASASAPLGGALLAFAFWGMAMVRLHRWIAARFGAEKAWATLLVFGLLPSSPFFWLGFSESLFLLLFVVYLADQADRDSAERGQPWVAAGVALLLPLARPVGICLAAMPAIQLLRGGRDRRFRRWQLVYLGAYIMGFLSYLCLMYGYTSDPLAGFRAQAEFVNAPSLQHLLQPGRFLQQFLRFEQFHSPEGSMLDRSVFLGCLVLLYFTGRQNPAWAVASAVVVVIPAFTNWFLSFSRFSIVIVPLWLSAGLRIARWNRTAIGVAILYGLLLQGWLWSRFLGLEWAS